MTSGSPGWDVWTPQDRDALHFDADSETACITLNSYPDTQESIRAAMAADTSLSAAEKETVEHLYFPVSLSDEAKTHLTDHFHR